MEQLPGLQFSSLVDFLPGLYQPGEDVDICDEEEETSQPDEHIGVLPLKLQVVRWEQPKALGWNVHVETKK